LVTGTVVVVVAAELELDDPQAASVLAAAIPPAVTSPDRTSERLEILSVHSSSTETLPPDRTDDPQLLAEADSNSVSAV
jgi:hypothetical protein